MNSSAPATDRRRANACAVCSAALSPGLLMCGTHWRLVPKPLQADVYRAWRRLQADEHHHASTRLQQYRSARDAAIHAATDAVLKGVSPQPVAEQPPQGERA